MATSRFNIRELQAKEKAVPEAPPMGRRTDLPASLRRRSAQAGLCVPSAFPEEGGGVTGKTPDRNT
nr:hypothetical protein SHINE37_42170 [Rhizobiaceae bacterium]